MPAKLYRKRPVEVEAFQFTEESAREVEIWCGGEAEIIEQDLNHDSRWPRWEQVLEIETLEGTMEGHYGDWIIKRGADEYYPCRDDIFKATYEEVTQ